MKIVCTSDTHFPFGPVEDGDVLIHAGDLMMQGTVNEWHARVESLRAQPHKTKLYVPGNHDYHPELYQGISASELRRAGVTLLGIGRNIAVDINGVVILGLPFVTGLDGWAFNRDEMWVRDYMEHVATPTKADIIVSHAPVYGIRDAILPEIPDYYRQRHVGCQAYNWWFHQDHVQRPKHWVHGHIHESYGSETEDGCEFHNVAMCNRDYEQVNPPIIIEV